MGVHAAAIDALGAHKALQQRRREALRLLDEKGVPRSHSRPPAIRLLWAIGCDVPPPHFASFATNLVGFGMTVGILFALFLWPSVILLLHPRLSTTALLLPAFQGASAGVLNGIYYARSARKLRVPRWREFEPAT